MIAGWIQISSNQWSSQTLLYGLGEIRSDQFQVFTYVLAATIVYDGLMRRSTVRFQGTLQYPFQARRRMHLETHGIWRSSLKVKVAGCTDKVKCLLNSFAIRIVQW